MSRAPNQRRNLYRFSQYTDGDMAHMMSIFNAHDEEMGKKTWTRKLVESTLSKMRWYNPQKDDPGAPSLSKAWTYYEHVTLARRLISSGDGMRRAEPGDTARTALYSPLKTPESALSEWGIGVALYFSTVRVMAAILFVTGVINVAMIEYYASDGYDNGTKTDLSMALLRGTAICTDQEWVVCDGSCTPERWEDDRDEFATGEDPATGEELTFVKRNMCNRVPLPQGMVSYGSLFFLALCFFLLGWYQHIQENWLDEDNVMSSDYTVRVSNPPKDSYDADKWKNYFEQFTEGNVVAVTVALDNARLLSALVQRRFFTEQLRLLLPGDVDMDNSSQVKEKVEEHIRARDAKKKSVFSKMFKFMITKTFSRFGGFLPAEKLQERISLWTEKVKEAQKEKYNVVQVYVTFEMQEDQRLALEATTASKIDSLWKHRVGAVDPKVLFDGKLLHVSEPNEPSTIRWLDLQVSTRKKIGLWLFTLLIIGCMMAVADQVFRPARNLSIYLYSICVSAVDCIIPDIVFALLSLEKHDHEGSFQMSVYFKITVFRCFVIVVVPIIITPFTHALGVRRGDLLYTTNALLISACLARPLYHLMDPFGNFRKHILGPRATTQEMMNLNFTGTIYHLGERYTDLTKIIILPLFYSSLDPRSFFIGSVGLFIQYYVDKFCLMRIWTTAPFIKTRLSRAFRKYFYATAVMVMAVISARAFAQFPYDNICDSSNTTGGFAGKYNATLLGDGSLIAITVEQDNDNQVIFCQQSLGKLEPSFPAVPEVQKSSEGKWMNQSQEDLTRVYGMTSFVIVIIYAVAGFLLVLGSEIKSIYKKKGPKRNDQDNLIDFNTENLGVQAYIPQVYHKAFDFPLLACDIDEVDQNLIGWNDPIHSYDFHNLIFDVPWPGMKRTKRIMTCTRGTATLSRHKDYEGTEHTATFSTEEEKETSMHHHSESMQSKHESPIFSIIKFYTSNGEEQAESAPISTNDVDQADSVPISENTKEQNCHPDSSYDMPINQTKVAEISVLEEELDLPFTQKGKFGSWSDSCKLKAPSEDSADLKAPSRSVDSSELKDPSRSVDVANGPTSRNESGWSHESGWENEVEGITDIQV